MDSSTLRSHHVQPLSIPTIIETITNRLKLQQKHPHTSFERTLDILNQLSQFNLGRFLLQHQGLNGYWTHYLLTFPRFGRKTGKNDEGNPLCEMEDFILNRAPVMLATQERFENCLNENQKSVIDQATLAAIPCGMMGELLYLNFTNIKHIKLVGIDYDENTFNDATRLANQFALLRFVQLLKRNAWQLGIENQFDLISSNGLNVYEPDNEKIVALYRQFYQALKPNGKLVLSFLTYPPDLTSSCEWNIDRINEEDLLLQKILFNDILQAKWHCFRSSQETKQQLHLAGFTDIHFIYDRAKMMPIATAFKK